jgi:aspartate/methionine/tyrosine aminotransferase
MNPLAQELNRTIETRNPNVHFLLSELGKALYFPKGILSQAAEAQKKATVYNATVGVATEGPEPMYLPCIQKFIKEIPPKESYPYAPAAGKPQLREKWQEKLYADNPSLSGKKFGLPIVTSGLTHGLELTAHLFVDPGDTIILPDQFWENYSLIYGVRRGAELRTFPLFNKEKRFNAAGLKKTVLEVAKTTEKIVLLFNFPNNPTGYSITPAEGQEIIEVVHAAASKGSRVLVIMDDAYFGLFYDDEVMRESLFGQLLNMHPQVLAIKLDGPTKEQFVWGFRIGFLTYGVSGDGDQSEVCTALEQKTMGAIRSGISNCSHLAQTIVLKALECPTYNEEKAEKVEILRRRAMKVRDVLKDEEFSPLWEAYPFNSGYFMCLKLKNVEAEKLRVHLLDRYGVGTIAMTKWDLRITFSSVEEDKIAHLFKIIAQAVRDLEP